MKATAIAHVTNLAFAQLLASRFNGWAETEMDDTYKVYIIAA